MIKKYKIPPNKLLATGQDDTMYNGKVFRAYKPFIIEDSEVIEHWQIIMSSVSEIIKSRNINQALIAEIVNTTQPNISKLLRGKAEPKLNTFLKIVSCIDEDFIDKLNEFINNQTNFNS